MRIYPSIDYRCLFYQYGYQYFYYLLVSSSSLLQLLLLFSPFLSQQSSVYLSDNYLSFTKGFSFKLFASKAFAHLKRFERFILKSFIKKFIITIRCLSCSRSEFSNVLDCLSLRNQVIIRFQSEKPVYSEVNCILQMVASL